MYICTYNVYICVCVCVYVYDIYYIYILFIRIVYVYMHVYARVYVRIRALVYQCVSSTLTRACASVRLHVHVYRQLLAHEIVREHIL